MGFPILYSILGMEKFIDTLETFLSQTLGDKRCSWKKKIYFTFNNKTLKNRLLLSSGETTLMYKYETCIIIASNLHHSEKEVTLSPKQLEFPARAGRKLTAFLKFACKLVILGTLGMPGHTNQKAVGSTYRKLRCLSTCRKSTWSLNSF